jgi:hypothetical protein
MSLRSPLRAFIRLAIIASVALSGVTFGANDADARRGGKVRSSSSHTKPHDGGEATRKTGDSEDGSAASHGGSYVPGVRVRSREASRGGNETTDAGSAASRRQSLIPAASSAMSASKDIDVPGCAAGMICTVCLAGCDGSINGIVDAQVKTPEPKARE